MAHNVFIDDSIKKMVPGCHLGYIVIEDVAIRGTSPGLTQEFMNLQQEVASLYQLNALPKLPRIVAVRSMYKKLAVDPSRYRPASEALVRRVLQNKGVYYVNSAVDVNNFCSIKFLLPFGLYDLDNIQGDIYYQLAGQGSYINVGGSEVSTDGKPFLTDGAGVFGNPTSDSKRTAVNLTTNNLLSVIYADEEVEESQLYEILDFTANMMVRHNGGRVTAKQVVRA